MITQLRLKEVLFYDSQTGSFYWLRNVGKAKANGGLAGSFDRHGYTKIRVDNIDYLAHRLAWLYEYGVFPEGHLDHINRCKTDNRILNLRLATDSQNSQNHIDPQSNNKSGRRGVSFYKGKWRSVINQGGKQIYLGSFKTIDEAYSAYLLAKKDIHGFFFSGASA